jgi:toxin-antitoxin system PIN domain toxin
VSVTLDANVLLYASDESSAFHERARERLEGLARGPGIVYLFWPVVMAYLRISTHPTVFDPPLALGRATANIERLLQLPHVLTAGEQPRFWEQYRDVALEADVRGNLVSDAHLVALMTQNGVRSIWTHDRDFRRFPGIEILDPFSDGLSAN